MFGNFGFILNRGKIYVGEYTISAVLLPGKYLYDVTLIDSFELLVDNF